MTNLSLSGRETLALVDAISTLTRAETIAEGWLGLVSPFEIAMAELGVQTRKLDTYPPAFGGWIRTATEETQRWRQAMCNGDDMTKPRQDTLDALAAARSVLRTWLQFGI